jgi:uncharacterized protein
LRYTFEWDPNKSLENLRKHKVRFEQAAEVFSDPWAISIFDEEHSESEERWVTLGKANNGHLFVLIHTFSEVTNQESRIRIISARRAKRQEVSQYEESSDEK